MSPRKLLLSLTQTAALTVNTPSCGSMNVAFGMNCAGLSVAILSTPERLLDSMIWKSAVTAVGGRMLTCVMPVGRSTHQSQNGGSLSKTCERSEERRVGKKDRVRRGEGQ